MNASHITQLRVRYAETDQMGVVYYSNYLVWFEIARTEFFRARGVAYRDIEEKEKLYLPVVESYCRYRAPLRYDDVFEITTVLSDIGASRVVFGYEIRKDGRLMTEGYTRHAFVNDKGVPVPVPGKIKLAFLQK
ncbi:MAG: thioesterase family protein [Candidatus Omnitrophica bacterium]|nr:thioesterase family protein [Candidatus Omnitrophota bacterium]